MKSTTNPPRERFPSRKLSVILENAKECNQDDILRAVADVVGAKNILYASKLSGARFCLYLSSESAVTTICARTGVYVNNSFLKCRKYVSDATQLLISNCPPEMSDDTLLDLLKPYGEAVSKPKRLGVSTVHDDLKHVLTWKRSIYMKIPDDALPCPEVLHVTSREGTKHSIYIQTNQTPCYFCKSRSHPAEECTEKHLQVDENFPAYIPSPAQRLVRKSSNTSLIKPTKHQVDPTQKSSSEDNHLKRTLTSNSTRLPPPLASPADPAPLSSPSLPLPASPPQPQNSVHDLTQQYSILITQSEPKPNTTQFFPNPLTTSLSKKRVLSPQSPQLVKQSSPQENQVEKAIPYYDSKQSDQDYSDIETVCSSLSFDDSKLSEQTFLDIINHCIDNKLRRVVHKFAYIYKLDVDVQELLLKLNELSLLCKNNNLVRKIMIDASHTTFRT